MLKLGFLGLGKMGAAMAPRLIEAGHPLTVWNRTQGKTGPLEAMGANVAATPAAVGGEADVVLSMVRDDEAARQIFCGPDGLLSMRVDAKLFIEMSTLRPPTARDLAHRCSKAGAAFIDAPVSGTVGPARAGRLMALVGGSETDLEKARPVLALLTRRIVHAGPVGQGALMKLVLNLPLAVYWQSLAEAIAMGHAGGLELETMLDAMKDSGAALAALPIKIPLIVNGSAEAAFDVATMEKDVDSILQTGARFGVPMPTARAALAAYRAAHEKGFGEADAAAIVRFLMDQPHGANGETDATS